MILKGYEARAYIEQNGLDKKYSLSDYKEKRTLDQNAYCWELITKIGNKLRKSKEEVYLQMLKDYGQVSSIMCLEEVNISDYVKYYELENKKEKNNKIFNVYKVYKRSSKFDTKK